jgi:SOS-response transcriptional repressor LexA
VKTIPIVPAQDAALSACTGAEPFALMVLGDAMAPEFREGDVIVIEPEGLATEGAFVLAKVEGEWMFRQLRAREGGWRLAALDGRTPPIDIPDLVAVRGVVIQRSRPGRRRENRLYGR